MGCNGSKENQRQEPAAAASDEQDEPPEQTQAQLLVRAVAVSSWAFVKSVSLGDAVVADWRAFVSTFAYFMDRELSATRSERRQAFELMGTLCPDAPAVEAEKYVDDRLESMLEAWTAVAEDGRDHIPRSKVADVLGRAKVHCTAPEKPKSFTFGELLALSYEWNRSTGLEQLFDDVARGSEILTPEQLSLFASYGADEPLSLEETKDVINKRLGGSVTRLRFLSFFGNPSTNDVLDPKRALSVWQDMSQPLTHYSVATRSVASMVELNQALAAGCRSLVLHVSHVNKDNEPMMKDGKSLHRLLHHLKEHAFITNPLPVVLCFLPGAALTVDMQDAVAKALTTELGDALARGLMFRGSHISDPKFTPLGLQNRFLVMAQQGALKPFVGFNVADMQRTGLGVRVTAVADGTPAARAGIGKQDWITHFNGEAIESKETLRDKLRQVHSGEEFRVRKEGLTEVTGIVGASVADHEGISKNFASLLFLNFMDSHSSPSRSVNHSDADEAPGTASPLPWDTQIEALPIGGTTVPSPDRRHSVSSLALDPEGHPLHHTALESNPTGDHFRFIQRASIGSEDTEERERAIADADLAGVQFIDTFASPAAERWARGKFSDNGHCGYVLQPRAPPVASPVASESTGLIPFSAGSNGGNGTHTDEPSGIRLDVELLALPGGKNGKSHPAHDPACAVALIGTPQRQRAPLDAHGVVNVRDPFGKVVLLRTVDSNGVDLEAALPAALVRPGYRIISFTKVSEPSVVVPVLCAVKRHPVTPEPSVSAGAASAASGHRSPAAEHADPEATNVAT